MSALFLVGLAWAIPCSTPSTSSDLAVRLDEAESAYARLDPGGFIAALDEGRELLPCVVDTVSRPLVARLHRAEGLAAFLDREPSRAAQAFAAARTVEPNYRFPDAIVPAKHPIRMTYFALETGQGAYEEVPAPAGGHLLLDGRDATRVPEDWPVVVQVVDDEGGIMATGYVWPGEDLPAYTPAPVTGSSGEERDRSAVVAGLGVTSGLSALATAGLLVAANAVATTWWATPVDDPDAAALRARANGLTVGAVATGSLSAATGIGALVTWTR